MKPIDKANAARRLTENDDFKAIMSLIEADIFSAFQGTSLNDSDELQRVHTLSHGFKLIRQRIYKYIELGNFEASKDEEY